MKHLLVRVELQADGLGVCGRIQKQTFSGGNKSRPKSSNKDKIYRYCKNIGHINLESHKLQNKNNRAR